MTTTPLIVAPPKDQEGPCMILARDGTLVPMTIGEQEIIRAGEREQK